MKRKLKESDCISYEEAIRRSTHKENLINKGFIFINKANTFKKICAYALITIGCLTLPLPTGSIFLIVLGLGMLGLKPDYFKRQWKLFVYNRKAKRNNKIN